MRILHVIDGGFRSGPRGWTPTWGFDQIVSGVEMLVRRLPHQQAVCVVGTRGAVDRAAALGLRVDAAVGASAAATPMSALARTRGRFDVVQAWGGRSARMGAVAGARGGGAVLVGGPAGAPRSERVRARYVALPPPARVAGRRGPSREAVRRGLGIDEREVAVLLVGEAPQADALRFVFLLSLLTVAGTRAVGIVPAGAAQLTRADRFARAAGRTRVAVSERPTGDLIAAADLGVFDSGGPGPTASLGPAPWAASWPIAWAHAAGVPVVAPAWAAVDELYLGPAARACLAHSAALPELARRLLALVDDGGVRSTMGRAVREAMGDPEARFCAAVERAWAGVGPDGNGTERGGDG